MTNIRISSLLSLFIEICFSFLIISTTSVYNIGSIILIIISIVLSIFAIFKNFTKLEIISYCMAIVATLLLRNRNENYIQSDFYLDSWFKILFTNKTVFVNVIGNILIYIPLYILIRHESNSKLLIIYFLIGIVFIEFMQYILKVGVFDIADIVLNFLGVLIVHLFLEVKEWQKNRREKMTKSEIKKS